MRGLSARPSVWADERGRAAEPVAERLRGIAMRAERDRAAVPIAERLKNSMRGEHLAATAGCL
jgi:hypothetical protein